MNVSITDVNSATLVIVEGRLDTMTAGSFETQVMPLASVTTRMVIDMSGLEYISSTGLRVFLLAQKAIGQKGGSLVLCNLRPAIREIFDIAGFSKIFSIVEDRESALAS